MGRDSYLTCTDCRVTYYLGYGSSSTWLFADTVEEYDALPEDWKYLCKNEALRLALSKHEGHKFIVWSHDWCSTGNGQLVNDYTDEILATDYSEYTFVDLEKELCPF